MPLSAKRAYFGDYVFVIDENVYEPAEDSFLFAENLAAYWASSPLRRRAASWRRM